MGAASTFKKQKFEQRFQIFDCDESDDYTEAADESCGEDKEDQKERENSDGPSKACNRIEWHCTRSSMEDITY